jgi:hypothetical protein
MLRIYWSGASAAELGNCHLRETSFGGLIVVEKMVDGRESSIVELTEQDQ